MAATGIPSHSFGINFSSSLSLTCTSRGPSCWSWNPTTHSMPWAYSLCIRDKLALAYLDCIRQVFWTFRPCWRRRASSLRRSFRLGCLSNIFAIICCFSL